MAQWNLYRFCLLACIIIRFKPNQFLNDRECRTLALGPLWQLKFESWAGKCSRSLCQCAELTMVSYTVPFSWPVLLTGCPQRIVHVCDRVESFAVNWF